MKDNNYIFGIHPVLEALESGKEMDRVMIKKGLTGENVPELMKLVRETNTPYQYVPIEKLNRITKKNHQGVIGFASLVSYAPIEEVIHRIYEAGEVPLIVAVDGVTDVRNLGAIARSAEVAGAHGILVPEKGSAQINPEAMKSSAGALNIISVSRTSNLVGSLKELRDSGLKLIGATEKAEELLYHTDMTEPVVLIMGSEDTGLSNPVLRICDSLVKIPQIGKVGSLNVSAAASVFLFEAVRQRITKP